MCCNDNSSAFARTLLSLSVSLWVFGDPQSMEAWGGRGNAAGMTLVQEPLCLSLCPQLSLAEPAMYRRLWTVVRPA